MIVAPIDEAIDAVWHLQGSEPSQRERMHHISMLITLEFLQKCGFNHVSLEEHEDANNN
jgi:hypothetical protein